MSEWEGVEISNLTAGARISALGKVLTSPR